MDEKKIEFLIIFDPVSEEECFALRINKNETKRFNLAGFEEYLNDLFEKSEKYDAIMNYISEIENKEDTNEPND